jgi:predicted ATPase with chaperone activity
VGLVGGGNHARPGEIGLAYRGVLFLDELPEVDARTLGVMRRPLEDHVDTISRARFASANTALACSADMRLADVREYCKRDEAGTALLTAAMAQLGLSARGFHLSATRVDPDG